LLIHSLESFPQIKKIAGNNLEEVKNLQISILNKYKNCLNKVDDFFQQILNSVNERKEAIKNKITSQFENETSNLEKLNKIFNNKLLKIEEVLSENKNIEDSTDLEILSKAKDNNNLLESILSDIPKIKKDEEIKFTELNKAEEITSLKIMLNKILLKEGIESNANLNKIHTETYYNKRNSVEKKLLDFGKIKISKESEKLKPPTKSLSSTNKIPEVFKTEKYSKPRLNTDSKPIFNKDCDFRTMRPDIPRDPIKAFTRKESKSRTIKYSIEVNYFIN
jgi:hypothetical protein